MSVLERGERFGLNRTQLKVLKWITLWFNLRWLELDDRRMSISADHEPDLETLCSHEFEELGLTEYHLRSKGLIEEQWIAGRPCAWAPTDKGLRAMEYIFEEEEGMYPSWRENSRNKPPLWRDGNEKLPHRKGVCATAHVLNEAKSQSSVRLYPGFPSNHRPDVSWIDGSGEKLAIVEMVSDHNDLTSLKEKYLDWNQSHSIPVIWIYENREAMIAMWNYIERETTLGLDGGEFGGEKSNWHPERVNAKIRRTRRKRDHYNSIECVQTLGGVLNSDPDEWERFLQTNHIID